MRAFAAEGSYLIRARHGSRSRLTQLRSSSISTAAPPTGVMPALHVPALPALKLPAPPVGWYAPAARCPFLLLHVAAVVSPFLVPVTWTAVGLGVLFYVVRMFGITGVYHRYFAHRAYKTSRWFQFVLAWLGCSAMQKGPLWWAGHHRHHHSTPTQEDDPHSPIVETVWWAHVGWVISGRVRATHPRLKDFEQYPRTAAGWTVLHWVPGLLARGALLPDRRLERRGLGLPGQHRAALPRHVPRELGVPPVRHAAATRRPTRARTAGGPRS